MTIFLELGDTVNLVDRASLSVDGRVSEFVGRGG